MAGSSDGYRILVDRLWPQGESKEKAKIDWWFKDIAPSNELREDFHHGIISWADFEVRYESELKANETAVRELVDVIHRYANITFLYASKNEVENNAALLKIYIEKKLGE